MHLFRFDKRYLNSSSKEANEQSLVDYKQPLRCLEIKTGSQIKLCVDACVRDEVCRDVILVKREPGVQKAPS